MVCAFREQNKGNKNTEYFKKLDYGLGLHASSQRKETYFVAEGKSSNWIFHSYYLVFLSFASPVDIK